MIEASVIEEDDVYVVPVEFEPINNKNTRARSPSPESDDTIIIDEEQPQLIEDTPSTQSDNERKEEDAEKESIFAVLLKNNSILNKIIQKCYKMGYANGVKRVIEKTLIPLYKDTDNKFKESHLCTNILNRTLMTLKHDPKRKFSHIKSLCEELKARIRKKKVPFITLATEYRNSKHKAKMKNIKPVTRQSPRKKNETESSVNNVIDLDNSDDDNIVTLSTDDESDRSDDLIIVENVNTVKDSPIQSNKENRIETDTVENVNHIEQTKHHKAETKHEINTHSVERDKEEKEASSSGKERNIGISKDIDTQKLEADTSKASQAVPSLDLNANKNEEENSQIRDLLVPMNSVQYKPSNEYMTVKVIEDQIKCYKRKIAKLEEEEVTENGFQSPYILCHKYKAKIVSLYKTLCKMTGNGDGEINKQRVVRMTVSEGHPEGPVRRLEKFLNDSIDETGAPPLPDFHDVVKCVEESNVGDQLGWSKQVVMKEALALFTQCGNALKKQRQKREYKDLLSLVQDKEIDDFDPANEDPLLLAKLEENKLIAKANEHDVIQRYAEMERKPPDEAVLNPRLGNMSLLMKSVTDSESDSEFESSVSKPKYRRIAPTPVIKECSVNLTNAFINTQSNLRTGPHVIAESISQNSINLNKEHSKNAVQSPIQHSVQNRVQHQTQLSMQSVAKILIDSVHNPTQHVKPNFVQNSNDPSKQTSLQKPSQHYMQNCIESAKDNSKQNTSQHSTQTPIQHCLQNSVKSPIQHCTQNNLHNSKLGSSLHDSVLYESNISTLHKIGDANVLVVNFNKNHNQHNIKKEKVLDQEITTEEKDIVKESSIKIEVPALEENMESQDSVIIKQEQDIDDSVQIQSLLDELGDNYISTIFDIEDPFLVIEISDSSDDE